VVNVKGEINGDVNEDELSEEFKVLLVDVNVENLNVKPLVKGTTWFIIIKGLLITLITLTRIANTLVNDFTSFSLLH
jgi:hypothetical protein